MKNAWLGYLSSVLMFAASVVMFMGGKILPGCIFAIAAVGGILIKIMLSKK